MDVTLLFPPLNSLVAAESCGYFISWESHWNQWQHKSGSFGCIIIVQRIAKKLWFCSGVNGKGTVTLILKWDCLCECLCVHEWMNELNTAGMSPSAATSLTNQGYSRLERQERHKTTSIIFFHGKILEHHQQQPWTTLLLCGIKRSRLDWVHKTRRND